MSPPDAPPPRRTGASGPDTDLDNRISLDGTRWSQPTGALAVLDTAARQLDGLAGLGAYAIVHGDQLDLVDVIAAVDKIGQRMRCALTVIDLRERQS